MHPRKYFCNFFIFLITLKCKSNPTGTTNKQAFQKIKLFDLPNNEKWFKFNAYEFFIKIRKKMTLMMNGVKHYVKFSMNECINNLKKNCLFANKRYIHINWDVRNVGTLPTSQTF